MENRLPMRFVITVREVEPGHIHSRLHQFAKHFRGLAGRTNGGNNFCSSHRLEV